VPSLKEEILRAVHDLTGVAVLLSSFGSRAQGTHHPGSDLVVAVYWIPPTPAPAGNFKRIWR